MKIYKRYNELKCQATKNINISYYYITKLNNYINDVDNRLSINTSKF